MSRGRGGFRGRGGGAAGGRGGGTLLTGTAVNPDFTPEFYNTQTKLFPEIHLQIPSDSEIGQKPYNIRYRKLVRNLSQSALYIQEGDAPVDIERYSDRFSKKHQTTTGTLTDIPVDFNCLPEELHSVANPKKKKRVQKDLGVIQYDDKLLDNIFNTIKDDNDLNNENQDLNPENDNEEEFDEDEDQYADDIDYDNDYGETYFDNGENDFYDDYDNNDDF